MKYKFINTESNQILTYGDDNTIVFGGPWGQLQADGKAEWAENTKTAAQLKEQKRFEMKAARDKTEEQPLEFKNTLLDFDQRSRERLSFAIAAKEQTYWTDYNNEIIELTVEDLAELPIIIKARTQAVHARYNALKEQIETATTKEAIDSITWNE